MAHIVNADLPPDPTEIIMPAHQADIERAVAFAELRAETGEGKRVVLALVDDMEEMKDSAHEAHLDRQLIRTAMEGQADSIDGMSDTLRGMRASLDAATNRATWADVARESPMYTAGTILGIMAILAITFLVSSMDIGGLDASVGPGGVSTSVTAKPKPSGDGGADAWDDHGTSIQSD